MTSRLEVRFAGGILFPLNKEGNRVREKAFLPGGRHRPFAHIPLLKEGLTLDGGAEWPESPACVVVHGDGANLVAIDLAGFSEIRFGNIAANQSLTPCLADIPHVPDLTGAVTIREEGLQLDPRAVYTTAEIPQGVLGELRVSEEWAYGEGFPLQRICSEVVWSAGEIQDPAQGFKVILKHRGHERLFTLTLRPDGEETVTIYLSSLCGWNGIHSNKVDFDGQSQLLGAKGIPADVQFSSLVRQPKTGGCPPAKIRS